MIIIIKYKHILNSIILCLTILITVVVVFTIFNRYSSASASEQTKQAIHLPIIMYHEVKTNNTGKDVITPYEFESDLKYLKEHNYHFITMKQLIHYVNGKENLPENPIVLTFDDGYLNTYKNVFPILKQFQVPIVLSIVGESLKHDKSEPP